MSEEFNMANELIPTTDELKVLETICKYAVDSKYFQSLGGFPGVMCIAMYAKEIGVSPMTAIMGGFSNVQGKITMSAELMHSLLRSAGVRLKIVHSDSNKCEIHGKRSDTGDEYFSVYTIEDAKKANLVKSGGSWEKNPSDMLFARCISRLRRRLAPDVATKAYVDGELDEISESKVTTLDVSPKQELPSIEEKLSNDQITELLDIIDDDIELFKGVTGWKGVKALNDLLAKDFEDVKEALIKKKAKAKGAA